VVDLKVHFPLDLRDLAVSRVELEVFPVASQAEQVVFLAAKVAQRKAHTMKAITLPFLV
jgi:hypothetical protein